VEDVPTQVLIVSEPQESTIENTQFVEHKPNHLDLGVVNESDEDSVVDMENIVYLSNETLDNIDNNETKARPDSIHEAGLEYYSIFYVKLDD
jgi:hypothetical protein